MKKALASLVAFVFVFSGSSAFAQMPMSVPGMMPAVPPALERVGVVAATQGKVKLSMPGEAGHIAESGEAVFISQEVATDAKGHLQILLLDETVFTIGPNSSITIDKFVYDPKSHDGEIRASIAKGIFRYVSGKIAAKKSSSVSMKLPTATIGFRGTIVGGSVEGNGQGLVALLGPGDNNDANAPIGSFTVEGQNGEQQDVNRTGFGVEVGANGGLSGVFQLSDEQVNNLTSGLALSGDSGQAGGSGSQGSGTGSPAGGTSDPTGGTGGQGGDAGGQGILGGGDMSSLSGETGALTGETSSLTGALTNFTAGLDAASNQAAQDARNDGAESTNTDARHAYAAAEFANTQTTAAQLDGVESGVYHYYAEGKFTELTNDTAPDSYKYENTPHVGTYRVSWDVDFDSWSMKNVAVSTAVSWADSHIIENKSSNDGMSTGLSQGGDPSVFNLTSSRHYLDATIELWNDSDSLIAGLGRVQVLYGSNTLPTTGSSDFVTVAATTIPDGLTTLDQLTHVAMGTCHYDFTGDYKDQAGNTVGALTGKFVVDFGKQQIGGGDSLITVAMLDGGPSVSTNGIDDGAQNFSDISNGAFHWTNGDALDGDGNIVGNFSKIDVTVNNLGGYTAQQATTSVVYDGSSGIPAGNGIGTGTLQMT
ncbi:MAG: FecR domain-containing protein [Candidatus Omnitrophica bacterium]|nr:FecR domain-containing protein [Candidatus Omnitrophota bacterium]